MKSDDPFADSCKARGSGPDLAAAAVLAAGSAIPVWLMMGQNYLTLVCRHCS